MFRSLSEVFVWRILTQFLHTVIVMWHERKRLYGWLPSSGYMTRGCEHVWPPWCIWCVRLIVCQSLQPRTSWPRVYLAVWSVTGLILLCSVWRDLSSPVGHAKYYAPVGPRHPIVITNRSLGSNFMNSTYKWKKTGLYENFSMLLTWFLHPGKTTRNRDF